MTWSWVLVGAGGFYAGVCVCLYLVRPEPVPPVATARFLVTQGRRTYQVDTEEEVAELSRNYPGVSRVERRNR